MKSEVSDGKLSDKAKKAVAVKVRGKAVEKKTETRLRTAAKKEAASSPKPVAKAKTKPKKNRKVSLLNFQVYVFDCHVYTGRFKSINI